MAITTHLCCRDGSDERCGRGDRNPGPPEECLRRGVVDVKGVCAPDAGAEPIQRIPIQRCEENPDESCGQRCRDERSATNTDGDKVWFITGTSRGFGREWAIAALDRGDRVAATARNLDSLADLVDSYGAAILPIELDVTDRAADIAAVARAHEHFGRLDVVVNNAGYGQFGFIEELSESQARDQIETNVFGALWITQAALPFLRAQRSGHIIQVSSIGGISAFANIGIYNASKWALEASPRRWPPRSRRSAST